MPLSSHQVASRGSPSDAPTGPSQPFRKSSRDGVWPANRTPSIASKRSTGDTLPTHDGDANRADASHSEVIQPRRLTPPGRRAEPSENAPPRRCGIFLAGAEFGTNCANARKMRLLRVRSRAVATIASQRRVFPRSGQVGTGSGCLDGGNAIQIRSLQTPGHEQKASADFAPESVLPRMPRRGNKNRAAPAQDDRRASRAPSSEVWSHLQREAPRESRRRRPWHERGRPERRRAASQDIRTRVGEGVPSGAQRHRDWVETRQRFTQSVTCCSEDFAPRFLQFVKRAPTAPRHRERPNARP